MSEHISFRFDWNEVVHDEITDVLGLHADILEDGSARWEAVAICVSHAAIRLTVDPDTDQIVIALEALPTEDGWASIPTFRFALGKPLGWSWIGINSQGYKDSFTLAFGDVVPDELQPRCMFLCEASSLSCFDLVPRRA